VSLPVSVLHIQNQKEEQSNDVKPKKIQKKDIAIEGKMHVKVMRERVKREREGGT